MTDIAETTFGPVQGRVKNDVLLFAGIPYAAAPVGEHRFKPPAAHPPWEAVRPATRFGKAAPQIPSGGMTDSAHVDWSEDCLYLNVSTPQLDGSRPVMVWIHGGGYRSGQGAIPWYDGQSFARNGDIVVVSINYRLGALGFTDLSRLGDDYTDSGVNGLLDQVAALRWVQENIANFGGDPARVTIAGESAGGFAVSTLLGSEMAQGLFTRAIPQSGAAHSVMSATDSQRVTDAFLAALGVTSETELQAVSTDDVLAAQRTVDAQAARGELKINGNPFYPCVGNSLLPIPPLDAIGAGIGKDVDVLIGTNKDESTLFIMKEVTEDQLSKAARRYGGDDKLVDAYRQMMPDASPTEIAIALNTDYLFRIPTIRLAEARCSTGALTWMYRFDWESRQPRLKATHALEIPFVFNNLGKPGVDAFIGKGEVPQPLADEMHTAWTRFVRDGDPGWAPYELHRRVNMGFSETSELIDDPDEQRRQAWQGIR